MEETKINKAVVYSHAGIELIKKRKLKELISVDVSNAHVGEEIYICDRENIHGIIILNDPNNLNKDFFKNHFPRHNISERFREEVWSDVKNFNAHSFRIRKVFKTPLKYTYPLSEFVTMGEFIKGIEIIEEVPINPITEMLKEKEVILEKFINKDAIEGKEILKDLFVDLYKLFIKRQEEKHENN